jgi:hypothetical protein
MKMAKVSTVLTKDKDCKSCVRFRGASDDKVTTSLYLQNDAHKEIGSPDKIKVTVEKSGK